jgi:hypothetical protein
VTTATEILRAEMNELAMIEAALADGGLSEAEVYMYKCKAERLDLRLKEEQDEQRPVPFDPLESAFAASQRGQGATAWT